MLKNKYNKLKEAVKYIPDNKKDSYLNSIENYNKCVIRHNKMERVIKDREQLFKKVKVEIDKFLQRELYLNNGWFISSPSNFENYEDHIIIPCKYGFNTLISEPFTLSNLNKVNDSKKRKWDDLELFVWVLNRQKKTGVILSWYEIPVVDGVDYSSDMDLDEGNRFQVELRFRVNV